MIALGRTIWAAVCSAGIVFLAYYALACFK